jgi:hypothetical protein
MSASDQQRWEAEQDDQERKRMVEERTAEAIDNLYRALRECMELAAESTTNTPLTLMLVDGLMMAEHERCRPSRPFPYERAGALHIQFLEDSAEIFLADIRSAVMLLRSTGPVVGGRRHGIDPEVEGRCICGWESTVGDWTPVTQHFRAVIELGGER